MIDVVRHPTQDGVHRGLGGVSPFSVVAGDLLNPFQVGDRHNADQQIHQRRHVVFIGDHTPVQTLIEEQVGTAGNRLPGGELARLEAGAQPAIVLGRLI